jgi:hypothetical protein
MVGFNVIAKTKALHDSGAKVIYDHIYLCDHLLDLRYVLRIAQIQRDAAFIAIEAAKYGVVGSRHLLEAGAAQIPGAHPFNLDDIRAKVSQRLGAYRPHHHLGKVDHADSCQGQARCSVVIMVAHAVSTVCCSIASAGMSGFRPD